MSRNTDEVLAAAPNGRASLRNDDRSEGSHSSGSSENSNESQVPLAHPDRIRRARPFGKSISQAFLRAFDKIYPPDGMDVVDNVHNNISVKKPKNTQRASLESLNKYRKHWGTRVASFLGLPTRRLNDNGLISFPDDAQSAANLIYNFLGWRDQAPRWKNGLRSLFMVPINTILLLLRLPLNIIKVFTELLPAFLNRFFKVCSKQASTAAQSAKKDNQTLGYLGYGFLFLAAQPFRLTFFLLNYMGEALTSPIEHFRKAITFKTFSKEGWGSYLGKRIFFGGLAIASSVAMYILAAPAAAFILKTYVAPLVVHHLPQFMINAYTWVADKIGPAITKFGSWLVENPAVSWVTSHVGLGTVYSTTTAAASLGAAFAVGITTLGTGINRLFENYFKPWWHKPSDADRLNGYDLDDIYIKNLLTSNKSTAPITAPERVPETPIRGIPSYPGDNAPYVPRSGAQAQRLDANRFEDWQAAKLGAGSVPSLGHSKTGLLAAQSVVSKPVGAPVVTPDAQKMLRPGNA